MREALDAGARIFKVHLQVGGFSPDDPLLDEVWGLLARRECRSSSTPDMLRWEPSTPDQDRSVP